MCDDLPGPNVIAFLDKNPRDNAPDPRVRPNKSPARNEPAAYSLSVRVSTAKEKNERSNDEHNQPVGRDPPTTAAWRESPLLQGDPWNSR